LGGAGYIAESILPRLFRESPLDGTWEGAGDVRCLVVLPALQRAPLALECVPTELAPARGAHRALAAAAQRLQRELRTAEQAELRARRLVELMALTLQGSLLVRHAPPEVADAFCASRLAAEGWHVYGALPSATAADALLERA